MWYYGCEWDYVTDASKGYSLEGYDGEDWLSLDLEKSLQCHRHSLLNKSGMLTGVKLKKTNSTSTVNAFIG